VAAAREDARGRTEPVVGVATHAPAPAGPPLWDDDVEGFDSAVRAGLAHTALQAAASAGGVAAGMIGRAVTELAVATSAGRSRYGAATEVFGSLTVRTDDGSSHWVDLDRRLAAVDTVGAIDRTVTAALAARGRRTLADGTYDVVLGPIAVGGMLESLAAYGFTGRQLAAGTGAVATRSGTAVAAPLVTIADDATHLRGLPFGFDMEGTDRRRVPLIEAGVVRDAVTDRATAARTGGVSTGHAHIAREEPPAPVPANLVVAAADASIAELIAGIERGVFVERFWYLRVVDPVRTTLTGVSRDASWLIEAGRLTTPVAGARWTEDVFGVLSRVDGVSRDVAAQPLSNIWNGCVTAPALRVRGFRFGPATIGGGPS
jgi:predicted Zn-dependent protease